MLIVYPTSNSNTPTIASSTTALAANPKRVGWMIQNLGQNVLYVLMGSGASTSVFHVALRVSTANDDGSGGIFVATSGTIYTGVITVAGTSPRYTVTEFAPG